MDLVADPAIVHLAQLIAGDASLLFVTGAGISADSGLPTYRGVGGLYDDAHTPDGIAIEDALSGPMFQRDPGLTWRYIAQIEQACRGAQPNVAHRVIASLERRLSRVVVLTQNVDGLHARAGSRELIAIHGDIHRLQCTRCDWRQRVSDYAGLAPLPRCPACDAVIRPGVVLFGEQLPTRETERLQAELELGFDAVVSVGTSSGFPYIAAPVQFTNAGGGVSFEINPGESAVSRLVSRRIRQGAAAAFSALEQHLNPS